MILNPETHRPPVCAEGFEVLNEHFVSPAAIGVSSDLLTECLAAFLFSRHILTSESFSRAVPTFDPTDAVTLRSISSHLKSGDLEGVLTKYAGKKLPVPKGQVILHRRHVKDSLKSEDVLSAVGVDHSICFSMLLGIALGMPPAKVFRRPSPVSAEGQNYIPVRCSDGCVRMFRLTKAGLHDQSWSLFGPDEPREIPVGGVLLFSTRLQPS